MKRLTLFSTLGGAALCLFFSLGSPSSASPGASAPAAGALRWGIALEADSPFYRVGQTAEVSSTLFNFSGLSANFASLVKGGNGCEFRITVVSAAGDTVWEPTGGGCLFSANDIVLGGASFLREDVAIPLVYDNLGGVGSQGAPLPPGFYSVQYEALMAGPHLGQSPGVSGTPHRASVPIQILD